MISLLLESAVKSSVILLIAFAALLLLRGRSSASCRHWVLATALYLAAAQPVLSMLLPAWSMSAPTIQGPVAGPSEAVETTVSFEVLLPPQSAARINQADISNITQWVWIGGVVMNLAVLLLGLSRLARLQSSARTATAPWLATQAVIGRQLCLARKARIVFTRHPALLVAWGVLRPVVLLPADAASWSADRIRVVIAHELAHVKRADWLVQVGAELLRSIFWFNPLFWIACSRLRQESEYACDDMVLALGIERTSYASHLVELARRFSAHGRTWLPAPAAARPSTLQRRVRAMLNSQLNRRPLDTRGRLAVMLALLCVALPVAGGATQTTGVVSGVVRDSSGRVLPDATIRLALANSDDVTQTRSDASGRFTFSAVTPGEHVLSARSAGFATLRQTIRLAARETLDLPLTLQIGTLQETITVTSGGNAPRRSPDSAAPAIAQPAPPSCTASTTGGQIVPPMKLRDVRPRYDDRLANVKGTVILDARIGTDGKVNNVEVFSAVHPDLEDAAIAAVNQWEFTPTWLNCEAVEVRMLVSVTFAGPRP